MKRLFACSILITLILIAVPVTATPPLGGTGWLTITCAEEGASVYIDNTYKGTISGGSLDIENGVSASTYSVRKDGFYDANGDINYVPGGDANLEIAVALTPKPVGSGKGWFVVHCNVDGASVAFDGVTKGTTSAGVFSYETATSATPFTSYSVSKAGYVTYTGEISSMPSDSQTIDLYATLNPVPTSVVTTTLPTTIQTTSPIIGGDEGWYKITSTVNGASVYLDSAFKGKISAGSLSVPVYSTGTPYKTYRVEMAGYETVTGSLPSSPAKGQTVTVHVTMVPVVTQTMTPQPTASVAPPGSGTGYIAIHSNINGATVTIGSQPAGIITNGVLKVPVSVTGTPFSAFTVSKPGYATTTGTIPRQPAAGETVDIYVTLNAEAVPTTESPLSPVVIFAGIIGAVILAVRGDKNRL